MNILTEEELKERNRLLVLENDELLAEVEKLKAENVILKNKVMMYKHIKASEELK